MFAVSSFLNLILSTLNFSSNKFPNFQKNSKLNNFKLIYNLYKINKNFSNNLFYYLLILKINEKNYFSYLNLLFFSKHLQNNFNSNNTLFNKKIYFNYFDKKSNSYNNLKFQNFYLIFKSLNNKFSTYNYFFNPFKSFSYQIKFSVSDFFKNLNLHSINKINIQFLRKMKIFNKGRYSRNRQYYRTGVYWCLYINIIAVVGIYFWFYRFNMNFGYLWWILYIFLFSFFFSKALSSNLTKPNNLYNNFIESLKWFFLIFNSLLETLFNLVLKVVFIVKKLL